MSKVKPRQWSMEMMRKSEYLTGITEFFNSHTNRRKDLFGFIDFIAIGNGKCIAVQCCARSGISSHRRKIIEDCHDAATKWIESGNSIEIHGWDRTKERLKSKDGYRLRRRIKVEAVDHLTLDKAERPKSNDAS